MGKESKGFLSLFQRDKRESKPEERPKPKRMENSRTKMDRLQKLSRLFKRRDVQETVEHREPTFAETYDIMCKSLEQFTINSRKHANAIDVAIAKYAPNVSIRDLNRHGPVRITSGGLWGVPDHERIEALRNSASSERLNDGQPNGNPEHNGVKDLNDKVDASPPAEGGEEEEEHNGPEEAVNRNQNIYNPTFDGDVIDVHELLESEYGDTPVSEYCQRYLDLANYIPSLSLLCKAEIKAIICDKMMRERTPDTDYVYKRAHLDEVDLPNWLGHQSLLWRWPTFIVGQIAGSMLIKNLNNNNQTVTDESETLSENHDNDHPLDAEESAEALSGNYNNNRPVIAGEESENNNGIVVSKSKYASTVPITTEQSLEKESSPKNKKKKSRGSGRATSTSAERRLGKRKVDRYFLAPVGSCSSQGVPAKEYHKWMDVASIVHQGTFQHRNLKPTRSTSPHTTLPQEMLTPVLAKLKCYSLRPLKPPMTSLKTLLEVNEIGRIFAETHAKFVCVNILMALQFLHNHDLFHGSICPAKILFNDKGYPCLTGFGMADIIDGRQGRPRERQDVCCMSPEQIYLDYVSEETDMFSLGALTYAMVYGRPPHKGPDYASSRRNVLTHKFEPPFKPEEMSSDGRAFIKKCIRKDDRRRFSLTHMKKSITETVDWFERLHEEKLYRQSIPSPILHVIKTM